jgi:tRNA dimethylallyltransferase
VIADLDADGDGSAAREPTYFGTRRYVRRQRSWFRRDHRISWLDGAASDNVERTLRVWRHVS